MFYILRLRFQVDFMSRFYAFLTAFFCVSLFYTMKCTLITRYYDFSLWSYSCFVSSARTKDGRVEEVPITHKEFFIKHFWQLKENVNIPYGKCILKMKFRKEFYERLQRHYEQRLYQRFMRNDSFIRREILEETGGR